MNVKHYYFTENNAYPKQMVEEYADAHDLTPDDVLTLLEKMEQQTGENK